MEEMIDSQAVSFCLSFSFYSSGRWEEIAAKVTNEKKPLETLTDTEHDIEFTFIVGDSDFIADEASGEGQIRHLFPIFNRDLGNDLDRSDGKKPTGLTIMLPLEKLFADELDSVPAGEYSVWRPKIVEKLPSRCKKSNSTGTMASKQWKLRDFLLLRRSNSEGKEEDSFVFMTPKKKRELKAEKQGKLETAKAEKACRTVNEPSLGGLCRVQGCLLNFWQTRARA